jgi:triosephosphate isomerase (TIM)
MRRKIVAGNWKMNLDVQESILLANAIVQHEKGLIKQRDAKIILFPQIANAHAVAHVLRDSDLKTGLQNISTHDIGAYTGEVSASAAKSIGCQYVLVGHSERRLYHQETSEACELKISKALNSGMKVVYCIGETFDQRNEGEHFHVVEEQCKVALKDLSNEHIGNIVLAYEPVWAIGTGMNATPDQAQEMHAFIRGVVKSMFGQDIAQHISILYGGSCNADNAATIFACADVDGGLIGSASLKADTFLRIIESI